MLKQDKYAYWVMLSDYDIDTVDCLVDGERWVYVAYLCQQAVERQLKGMYVYYNNAEAPKTHNVNFLFTKIVSSEKMKLNPEYERFLASRDEVEGFMVDLMFYYMSDYPFSYKNIMNRFVKKEIALDLFEKSKKIIKWLRSFQKESDIKTNIEQ